MYEQWLAHPDMVWRECGKGWDTLIDAAVIELAAVGVKSCHWLQIKEKFGGLRLYFSTKHLPDDVATVAHKISDGYERQAAVTCERCGKPGAIVSVTGYLSTLCDDCKAEK